MKKTIPLAGPRIVGRYMKDGIESVRGRVSHGTLSNAIETLTKSGVACEDLRELLGSLEPARRGATLPTEGAEKQYKVANTNDRPTVRIPVDTIGGVIGGRVSVDFQEGRIVVRAAS